MRHSLRRLLAVSLTSLVAVGCSSKPAEPTLAQQVEAAQLETNAEIRARTLIDLSAKQRALKDSPGAAATMTLALKSAQEVKQPAVKAEVLLAVAKELSDGGGSKLQASAAIDAARVAAATIIDRGEKVAATIELAVAVKKLGEDALAVGALNNAESSLEGITKPEEKAPLAAALGAARAVLGDKTKAEAAYQEAAETAAGIAEPRPRVRTQAAVAAVLYRDNQPEAGRKFYDAAVASARGISDPQGRAYALGEIFEALSAYRTRVPVVEAMQEAGAAANEVRDLDQKGVLLRHLQSLQSSP